MSWISKPKVCVYKEKAARFDLRTCSETYSAWKRLGHHLLRGGHELGGEAHLAVRAQHRERRDVPVDLRRVLLHLRQHVADDLLLGVLGDVEQLRPREAVVEVVLHLVVLGQAREVAVLHLEEVVGCGIAN